MTDRYVAGWLWPTAQRRKQEGLALAHQIKAEKREQKKQLGRAAEAMASSMAADLAYQVGTWRGPASKPPHAPPPPSRLACCTRLEY
eukprot:COSAG01_NODE_6506_length_3628_cov_17.003117_5_plen_87_part_00